MYRSTRNCPGSFFVVRRRRVRGGPAAGAADVPAALRLASLAHARRYGLSLGGSDDQQEGHRQDYQVRLGVAYMCVRSLSYFCLAILLPEALQFTSCGCQWCWR